MQNQKALIIGLSAKSLNADEKHFIKEHNPWGFVLFARNIETGAELRSLINELRTLTGRSKLPVFVDQEGGRVQRLRPPLAPNYPAAAEIGKLYQSNKQAGLRAAWLVARLIAADLFAYGFTADFMPLLDIPVSGSHDVIGDRAFSMYKDDVIALGRQNIEGLTAGGILPVMKHIPGHGRAFSDTHKEPAKVDVKQDILQATDFSTFKALADLPVAMTAHVIYSAYDEKNPATLSKTIIHNVIRKEIGFDGLLMSDDLSMQALPGTLINRTQACFEAGCDMVLHCNGAMSEMQAIADYTPYLTDTPLRRAQEAEQWIKDPQPIDRDDLFKELSQFFPIQ